MLRFSCGRRTVSYFLRLFQHFFTVKNETETSLFIVLYIYAYHVSASFAITSTLLPMDT